MSTITSAVRVPDITRCTFAGGCDQLTCVGNMCAPHAAQVWGVELRPSGIPCAGMGLFATRDIPRGVNVAEMLGPRTWHEDEETMDVAGGGSYVIELPGGWTLDSARPTDGFARYANDCRSRDREEGYCVGNNAHYAYDEALDMVFVRTSRRVRAGQEICVSYGRLYWGRLLRQQE